MPSDAKLYPGGARSRHEGGGWYDGQAVKCLLVGAMVVAGLVGCSSGESSSGTTLPPMPTAQAFPKDLNAAVAQRTVLPDCGEYDATIEPPENGGLSESAVKAQNCFWAAYEAGSPGELRVIAPHFDMPAQAMILRILAKGKYEIYTQYEDQKWSLQSCPAFVKTDQRLPTCG